MVEYRLERRLADAVLGYRERVSAEGMERIRGEGRGNGGREMDVMFFRFSYLFLSMCPKTSASERSS